MKAYIEAGVAGVHFEDQLASEKKCGHLGGKVLIPTQAAIRNLDAARLAADVCGVPTILVARTDAESAKLITSRRRRARPAVPDRRAHARGLLPPARTAPASTIASRAASPSRRMPICCGGRPAIPNLDEARDLRRGGARANSRASCSPTIARPASTGRRSSTTQTIAKFQRELGAMGYKFQFVTLAGFHSLNHGMFELASGYRDRGMAAYSELQQAEFASEADGLHRDPPPARGRHRLFRRHRHRHFGRPGVDRRARRNRPKPPSSSRPSKRRRRWDSVIG